jgi:hypothetical protein
MNRKLQVVRARGKKTKIIDLSFSEFIKSLRSLRALRLDLLIGGIEGESYERASAEDFDF